MEAGDNLTRPFGRTPSTGMAGDSREAEGTERFADPCRWAAMLVALWLAAASASAQDMSPRTYWPAPTGTRVTVVGYSYARGDVLFDPSIPLYGVDSKLNDGVLGYLQTFNIRGRTANALFELPYSKGTTVGSVGATPASGNFSGLADIGATLSMNIFGAPAMTPDDFQALRADPHAILGASLKVVAPTGEYHADRLLNVGGNRWAVRTQIGYILPVTTKFHLELEAGAWFFGDDDDYVAGRREQDPVFSLDVHFVRRFRPGFWASLNVNYFTGGRQTIGGKRLDDVQRNSRLGGTIVVPFRRRNAIKIAYATGMITKFGTDFDRIVLSYQRVL